MAFPLSGYTTHRVLRASARTRVYEAERDRDHKRVVAKVFEVGDESVEARVEHEFRLLQELDLDGVVRALGVERAGREVVLLLEHVAGRNLGQLSEGRAMAVATFLPLAVSMAEILGRIHARRVIHRDIKPSNILIERGTDKVVFADFGISVLLEDERRHLYDPEVLEGTLPYVSPEQTGRTKREVDFRSDLYSLGVTFYELLTGRRPFESSAPMELIHAHLARRPRPPKRVVPGLPERLSAIVMKLLEKAPEHRYQSAVGLHADLRRLQRALAAGVPEPTFALGEEDRPLLLQLPHQLYGRERERRVLEEELAAVVRDRARRLVLVSGSPGVGKSALVRSLEVSLSERRGYLAIGKFEARGGDSPYAALFAGFAHLLEQVLTESDERLDSWRDCLREALGPVAGVVAALIPELVLVIGATTAVPELELAESRNRLHLAFVRLLSGFTAVGPVLFVLDDLQWADAASLELLAAVIRGTTGPVCFALTARSEPSSDALTTLLAILQGEGVPCRRLSVGPLDDDSLRRMLADVLGRSLVEVAPLAEHIGRKTGNSPLFVRQLLLHLADEDLLRPEARGWSWDLPAIVGARVPDDVIGVLTAKLERLSAEPRTVLELAACVGERFEPQVLEAASGLAPEQLAPHLHTLEQAGLIDAIGHVYQFAHERIRVAARELIPAARRPPLHAAIGRHLLNQAGGAAALCQHGGGERLFMIVDQLDEGIEDIDRLSDDARRELAELNVCAGERALQGAAWTAARRYFELAQALLGAGSLDDRPRFIAHFGLAQALLLNGEIAAADAAFEALLTRTTSVAGRAAVIARRLRILQLTGDITQAVDVGVAALRELGQRVPRPAKPRHIGFAIVQAWRMAKGTSRGELLALAPVSDERSKALMHLLGALTGVVFSVDQALFIYLSGVHARLILARGYHDTAIVALSELAFAVVGMGQAAAAGRLAEDALALADARQAGAPARQVAEGIWLLFIGPCYRPYRDCAAQIEQAHLRSVELGEHLDAGFRGSVGLVLHIEACTHLAEIRALYERMHAMHPDWCTPETAAIVGIVMWFHGQLTGAEDAGAGAGASMSANASTSAGERRPIRPPPLPDPDDPQISALTRCALVVTQVWVAMLLGDYAGAWDLAEGIADRFERDMFGSWVIPRAAVLDAVLCGWRFTQAPEQRRSLLRRMRKRLAVLRRWAKDGADNFQPLVDLVAAEIAVVRGEFSEAVRGYEDARRGAARFGRAYVEGLACLRLADLAERSGWTVIAEGALRGAHRAFERWGAWAVVAHIGGRGNLALEAARVGDGGDTLSRSSASSSSSNSRMHTTLTAHISGTNLSLDLATILETVQMISEDLRLEEVITRVLGSAIESAGADRGVLLLERDGELAIVAEGRGELTTAFLNEPFLLSAASEQLPTSVVNYVLRTGGAVVVDDMLEDSRFGADPYVARSGVRSVLCMAIVKQSERIGALLLENRLQPKAFSDERLQTSRILVAQAANALDNARLYAELARSEAQWRSLVDGAPDVITLLDEQGRIEFINHFDPYELDVSELIGTPGDALFEPTSAVQWRATLTEVLGTGELRELEICVAPPQGERRWFMTRLAAISVQGRQRRVLSIATDITERKGFDAQLRQQQRLEAIGTLAAGVAHEINNPVQGIMNYAELIHERAGDVETVREFADEIGHESERVATIVRNLLVFSRQERERGLEPVAVDAMIQATLSLIHTVMRRDHVQLQVELDDDLPQVRCRSQQIQQILMNLVTNARDALDERYPGYDARKQITISAQAFERRGAPWVRVSVRDQAGGIPEEIRARIFDPFFTTKGRDKGTGLGLSVSHGIAVEHEGELRVESEVGVGSCFLLELPVAGPSGRRSGS